MPSRQQITLPPSDCECGYPQAQYEAILREHGRSVDEFNRWMNGQTMPLCTGELYSHERKEHYPCCGGKAHGMGVYGHDLARFLDRRPIVDW